MNTAKKAALVLATTGLALGAAAGSAFATSGAQADGRATNSPGIGSGNLAQVPVHVPVNATGNSANVIGVFNPTFDNVSSNN
ncbi:chaplin [Streptomyces lydicamycinicus]|uniref:Putative chaplin protein n=1 Tax=Streptomyces lydicamycinicus TaxID=1546107 RepID=A0A0P4RFE7_9ACTN|nr:chaplin [Streptomyces lydicamycinicus]GAO12449.1 putative chaplin protein [Streptomyces lydicamycinicus]